MKYVDDPELRFATRGRWRYVLYSEYFTLANYRRYCHGTSEGQVDWPWNVHNRGYLPVCVENPLQRFIEKQYCQNAKEWHNDRSYFYSDNPKQQKKWEEMKCSEILNHFDDYIEKRNAQLMDKKEEDGVFQDRQRRVNDYNANPGWKRIFDGKL